MTAITTQHRTVGTHEDALPYLFESQADMGPLATWCEENRPAWEEKLYRHGAVLFRGFGIETPELFEGVAQVVTQNQVAAGGEHVRLGNSTKVYTPVPYPADQFLQWHNENSFNPEWPKKIIFCPVVMPEQGGDTPVVDSREIYNRLGADFLAPFEEKGILYHRTYGLGVGRSWQDIFGTTDASKVEAYCDANGIEYEWRGEGLVTRQRREAVARHSVTGEKVWFAQAQHWHPACLDEDTRDSLEDLYDEDEMPRNCFYGDGEVIEDETMETLCEVYDGLGTYFPWQKGDVMVVDNVLAAHARNPYVGERKLLVTVGELTKDYCLGTEGSLQKEAVSV